MPQYIKFFSIIGSISTTGYSSSIYLLVNCIKFMVFVNNLGATTSGDKTRQNEQVSNKKTLLQTIGYLAKNWLVSVICFYCPLVTQTCLQLISDQNFNRN